MSNPLLTLDDWLNWQLRVHPREIELGLDRVRAVWQALGAPSAASTVITVGGTNGKGSTVAFLEAILLAGGRRVGAFTSPHLLRYNERVRVQGEDAGDQTLIDAFARIEAARGDTALTYFEFGTLAALLVFAESDLDVAILEVGLGGRLDAVNIIDADAAIVTTVDLDHQDWLGNEREVIAVEKAGIFRTGKPAILGELAPPRALISEAHRTGAQLFAANRDFLVETSAGGWRWSAGEVSLDLPHPQLDAACQHANAAVAIMALHTLRDRVGWQPGAIIKGVAQARAAARLQRFPGPPELIVDVAHNPQAARVLAEWLDSHPCGGKTIAVFGALGDKDIEGIVAPLRSQISDWHLAGLDADSERGLDARGLLARIGDAEGLSVSDCHAGVTDALKAARESSRNGDRIIAFGSFFVAAAALEFAEALANTGH
jgi:dihydrofolate synthase / folylpolyglutamate synthase